MTSPSILLIGNPNCGKTSLFNMLCKTHQKVGNYPGVTVEKKTGLCFHRDQRLKIIDLPGTYSLSASSLEEKVARQALSDNPDSLILNIVDSTSLERNLYLTLQLLELGRPMILVLNMADEMQALGLKLDLPKLSQELGIPCVATAASRNLHREELLEAICQSKNQKSEPKTHKTWLRNPTILEELHLLTPLLKEQSNPEWLALSLLENEPQTLEILAEQKTLLQKAEAARQRIVQIYEESPEAILSSSRYQFIQNLLNLVLSRGKAEIPLSSHLDKLFMSRVLGLPLFFLIVYLTFQLVFTIGQYPMDWIQNGFDWLAEKIGDHLKEGSDLKSLLIDGLIGGVGGVIVFLPNIVLLFLAIAFLDGSGYLARAAFIMDRVMRGFGLHGKSFMPLVSGMGCTVPSIMATRVLENQTDRFTTLMVLPLVSCSARLPIYGLLIPIFFPLHQRGLVLFILYLIGILLLIASAKALRTTILSGQSSPFLLEMPPLRMPTLHFLCVEMWNRAKIYLSKAGTVILIASLVLWALGRYPKIETYSKDYPALIAALETKKEGPAAAEQKKNQLLAEQKFEALEFSLMGRIGKTLEPVFSPLGFDWKITTALIGALAAKEVFVSQLGIVYSVSEINLDDYGGVETDSSTSNLSQTIKRDVYPITHAKAGQPVFTPLVAFVLMLFCLISTPCISTVAVTIRETNSYLWGFWQFSGLTFMAWWLAFFTYRLGLALGF